MRHRKSGRKLKRTASHRRATLASLATALLRHKRITTTVAKAKETRMVVEKLITRARRSLGRTEGDAPVIHARRQVARLIKDRAVVSELFSSIAEKIGARPGGYTRIVRLGRRYGDGAELAVIELVDYNTGQEATKEEPPAREKKPRRSSKKKEEKPRAEKGASDKEEASEAPKKKATARKKKSPPEDSAKESR